MGRWTQYDEDEYRLPEGMERIGYDSDSGRYFFRDRDGVVWQGAQGAEYSEMTRVSEGASSSSLPSDDAADDEDLEAAPVRARSDGYQQLSFPHNRPMAIRQEVDTAAYRTLFPFFLLIGVILLLVWRLILSPGLSAPENICPRNSLQYLVEPGDYCWKIAQTHGCSLEDLVALNPKVDCGSLLPGATVCIPQAVTSTASTAPTPA